MKFNASSSRKPAKSPALWREEQYTALHAGTADRYEDRVSENIFDVEDERAEVDDIVRGMMRRAN